MTGEVADLAARRGAAALGKVAHDAWCAEDDWDKLDDEARGDWENVARDVIAAFLARHVPSPRDKEGYYRHSALRGYWGTSEPGRMDYPLTTICAGCGKTIRCQSPEDEWEHVEWT